MKKILFILFAFFLFFASNVFADDVTLTTYYPAPFGMYQEMRVMGKLGVGTTIPVASLDVAGSIISDGGSGDVDGSGTLTEQDAQLIKLYVAVGTNFTRKQIAEASYKDVKKKYNIKNNYKPVEDFIRKVAND